MYKIRKSKAKELQDGRTYKFLAEKCGVTDAYLSQVFSTNKVCSQMLAQNLISIKENISINNPKMEEKINYYFILL